MEVNCRDRTLCVYERGRYDIGYVIEYIVETWDMEAVRDLLGCWLLVLGNEGAPCYGAATCGVHTSWCGLDVGMRYSASEEPLPADGGHIVAPFRQTTERPGMTPGGRPVGRPYT